MSKYNHYDINQILKSTHNQKISSAHTCTYHNNMSNNVTESFQA